MAKLEGDKTNWTRRCNTFKCCEMLLEDECDEIQATSAFQKTAKTFQNCAN